MGWKSALSKQVVVLEELKQSNAVPFDDILNLFDELFEFTCTVEISVPWVVGGLGTGGGSVDGVFKNVAVF